MATTGTTANQTSNLPTGQKGQLDLRSDPQKLAKIAGQEVRRGYRPQNWHEQDLILAVRAGRSLAMSEGGLQNPTTKDICEYNRQDVLTAVWDLQVDIGRHGAQKLDLPVPNAADSKLCPHLEELIKEPNKFFPEKWSSPSTVKVVEWSGRDTQQSAAAGQTAAPAGAGKR